jgi:hypothetical protein
MPELLLQYSPHNEQVQTEFFTPFEGAQSLEEQDQALQFTPAEQSNLEPETPTLRQRLVASRVGQTIVRGLMCLGVATGGVVVAAAPAQAESSHTYTVENTDGDGVWLHGDPGLGDKGDLITIVPEGTQVTADCYVNDTPVGKKNNPAWLRITYDDKQGFISDAFTSSRWNRSNTLHDQGLAFCGEDIASQNETEQPPEDSTDVKACYYNLKAPKENLTFSYEGDHRYYGNAWQAAKNWTDVGAGITIKPDADRDSDTAYIQFKDVHIDRYTVIEGLEMNEGTAGAVVIPRTKEWLGPHTSIPQNPKIPEKLTILVNKYVMDQLNDFQRTYVLTHEVGHTLGLAHTNGPAGCGIDDKSIMNQGSGQVMQRNFNTPMPFDQAELKQLYG